MIRPSAKQVRELLDYDPVSGIFQWKVSRGGWGAGVAGRTNTDGYRRIGLFGQQFAASHLAFLLMTGEWPTSIIDHKDRDRANNSWRNLRAATPSQNIANACVGIRNTSGFKGVSRIASSGRWVAHIKVAGKSRHLGIFDAPEEAHQAYCRAAEEAFGQFFRAA